MRRVFYSNLIPLILLIVWTSFGAAESAAQKATSMELLDVKQSATQTTITIEGQVKNVSSSEVRGVTVYCDFLGASRRVVRTEETNLETDPLPPNKVSDFNCATKSGPEIKGYNLRFVRLFGGPLVVKPSAKK